MTPALFISDCTDLFQCGYYFGTAFPLPVFLFLYYFVMIIALNSIKRLIKLFKALRRLWIRKSIREEPI
jgi:hypothetical protein